MSGFIRTASTLFIAALASQAFASANITVNDGSGSYNGTDGTGGAFAIQVNSGYAGARLGEQGLGATQFHTFCIERSEFLSFGGVYNVSISDSAKLGGNSISPTNGSGTFSGPRNNVGSEDVLSFTTAAIYREFRNNGNYGGAGSVAGTGAAFTTGIQWAIWRAESELSNAEWTALAGSNPTEHAHAVAILAWAASQPEVVNSTLGNVRVLNVYTLQNTNSQDLLTLIPLPGATGLAMAGMLGLTVRRRRSM